MHLQAKQSTINDHVNHENYCSIDTNFSWNQISLSLFLYIFSFQG